MTRTRIGVLLSGSGRSLQYLFKKSALQILDLDILQLQPHSLKLLMVKVVEHLFKLELQLQVLLVSLQLPIKAQTTHYLQRLHSVLLLQVVLLLSVQQYYKEMENFPPFMLQTLDMDIQKHLQLQSVLQERLVLAHLTMAMAFVEYLLEPLPTQHLGTFQLEYSKQKISLEGLLLVKLSSELLLQQERQLLIR